MKKILPVLLCYVLAASQVYAVDGGPVFTQNISPVGTFSGVLEGLTQTDDTASSGPAIPGDPLPAPNNSNVTASNALGLFNLSVPVVGNASGAFVLFANGVFYNGAINAFADPNTDKLQGVLEAATSITITALTGTSTTTTITVAETAVGFINATVSAATYNSASLGNLNGTANLEISYGEVDPTTLEPIVDQTLTFTVLGVEQSAAATTTTASTGTAGITSSGG